MIECLNLKNVINYQEVELLKQTIKVLSSIYGVIGLHEISTINNCTSLQVLSVIKWKGPASSKLTSKFWKQMVYEMPAKQIEMPSRDQVSQLDFGFFFECL